MVKIAAFKGVIQNIATRAPLIVLALLVLTGCVRSIYDQTCLESIATEFCGSDGGTYYETSFNSKNFRCLNETRESTKGYFFTKQERNQCLNT